MKHNIIEISNVRSLKCDRLRVHKNFMLSLVIRYLVSVVYYEPYIYGQENPSVWFKELGQVSRLPVCTHAHRLSDK